jgi:hypothetical protein
VRSGLPDPVHCSYPVVQTSACRLTSFHPTRQTFCDRALAQSAEEAPGENTSASCATECFDPLDTAEISEVTNWGGGVSARLDALKAAKYRVAHHPHTPRGPAPSPTQLAPRCRVRHPVRSPHSHRLPQCPATADRGIPGAQANSEPSKKAVRIAERCARQVQRAHIKPAPPVTSTYRKYMPMRTCRYIPTRQTLHPSSKQHAPISHTHTVRFLTAGSLWKRGRGGRTLVQAAAIGIVHDGHDPAAFVH